MAIDLEIDRYFQPFQSIRSETGGRFVGRRDAIVRIFAQLQGAGGALSLIGDRGVGKTSLGWKLFEILSGNEEWAKKHSIPIPKALQNYITIWVECTPAHENLNGLILSVLRPRDEDISEKKVSISEEFLNALSTDDVQRRVEDALEPSKFEEFQERLRSSYEQEYTDRLKPFLEEVISDRMALNELFRSVISTISKKTGKRVFIFFDEMGRLPDKSGIGDFIKTGRDIRFCSIGVFKDIDLFVDDHPSSERKIIAYPLNPLSTDEIAELFAFANKRLRKDGLDWQFDVAFIDLTARYSGGFPYLAQRIGYEALVDRISSDATYTSMSGNHFYAAMMSILQPSVDQGGRISTISKFYKRKGCREILEFISGKSDVWISASEVKSSAKYRFDANVNDLKQSNVLESHAGRLRFTDPRYRAISLAFSDVEFEEFQADEG